MTGPATYVFRPASLSDLPLLSEWQALPHVARWWSAGGVFDAEDLADPRLSLWMICLAESPIGYLQSYAVHGWEQAHHFGHLPQGSRGIDLFIGPEVYLGQGHGPRLMAQHVAEMFAEGVPVVAADPHPDNARSIAAFEKAGFRRFAEPQDTQWGRIVPMRVDRGDRR